MHRLLAIFEMIALLDQENLDKINDQELLNYLKNLKLSDYASTTQYNQYLKRLLDIIIVQSSITQQKMERCLSIIANGVFTKEENS